jgi:hypothetical protein
MSDPVATLTALAERYRKLAAMHNAPRNSAREWIALAEHIDGVIGWCQDRDDLDRSAQFVVDDMIQGLLAVAEALKLSNEPHSLNQGEP